MSNNKQSSVEWFWLNLTDDLIGDLPPEKILKIYELKEQAKAMHKEEIIDAHGVQYDYSYSQIDPKKVTGEKYYNETFGGEK